jgi:hypothetical protein
MEALSWAAGTEVANSMTKQSVLETSSDSSFTGGDLDDDALEEARADGDALIVGGGRGVFLSFIVYTLDAHEASSNLKVLLVDDERCCGTRSNGEDKPVDRDGEDVGGKLRLEGSGYPYWCAYPVDAEERRLAAAEEYDEEGTGEGGGMTSPDQLLSKFRLHWEELEG